MICIVVFWNYLFFEKAARFGETGIFILIWRTEFMFLRFDKAFGLCLSKQTLPAKTFKRGTRTIFINLAESFIKEQEKRLGFANLRITVSEKWRANRESEKKVFRAIIYKRNSLSASSVGSIRTRPVHGVVS